MDFPEAYIQYLVHFHGDRDYFECHEILEEHWKQVDSKNRDSVWVGLIQLAVSLYHYRRKNLVGGIRLLKKALSNLSDNKLALTTLKIEANDLLTQINLLQTKMKNNEVYESINIKLMDEELLGICRKRCEEMGVHWGSQEDLKNNTLIHRHMLRDRTSIEVERYVSASSKKHAREQKLVVET